MASIIPDQPPVETGRDRSSAADTLPVATPPTPTEATASLPPAPSGTPRTLLVVDDQPGVCASIAYFLEVCGYRTFRAESGQAALDLFGREQIDGVLLDVQMPRLNGFETCARLREFAQAANRPLKVWFMTGVHYRELKEDCARAGGVSFFQKPFDWPQLLAELEQGLSTLPPAAGPGTDSAPIPT
ncbi:MAG: response regulator [Verrucomicrobiota bacterium]